VCALLCVRAFPCPYMRDPRAADLINDRRYYCGLAACMKSRVEMWLTADVYIRKHVRVLPEPLQATCAMNDHTSVWYVD
jgi:hypothetical protein